MKNYLLSTIALIFLIQCQTQELMEVNLFFNLDNNEIIEINEDIEQKRTKKFFKNNQAFYIEHQYFKIENQLGSISLEEHKNNNYVTINYLIKAWDKSKLISSLNVFKKIYIIEKVDNEYYKYRVTWNGNKTYHKE